MRSNIRYLSLLLLLLLHTPLYGSERSDALEYLNTIRKGSGLIPLHSEPLLKKAATAHAEYLISHQRFGHIEKQGTPGYTGKTPADRVVHYGYSSKDVMENISVNAKSERASVDDLLAAIYHRFVFLSFDKDEIGIGKSSTKKSRKVNEVQVYNLGSSKVRALCNRSYIPVDGVEYIQNICQKSELLVPYTLYEKNRTQTKSLNPKVLLHPYPGQKEVSTVFYNETPDPLPDYQVSGYPVSVQFNDLFYDAIDLKSFRLFETNGNEVKMTRVFTYESDPYRKFKKTEFALMPLKRLEYDTTYRAYFSARVDGKAYERSWQFSTKSFDDTLYRITSNKTELYLHEGDSVILYFVPRTPHDILTRYKVSSGLEIALIDQNTMRVTLTDTSHSSLRLETSGRVVEFR